MKPRHHIWKSVVPRTKHGAVAKALRSTFGTLEVEDIAPLTGGCSSALVYKIMVDEKPYVLRIILRVDAFNDPVRQYACMNAAAEAGISPHVHYADTKDALAVTDFIATVPSEEPSDSVLVKLAQTIKSIHTTPLFPALVNYLDGIDRLIERFCHSDILPEEATREHFRHYAQVRKAYPRHDPDLVSSHNDLNPRNILFDGKRLWVIDWRSATIGTPTWRTSRTSSVRTIRKQTRKRCCRHTSATRWTNTSEQGSS